MANPEISEETGGITVNISANTSEFTAKIDEAIEKLAELIVFAEQAGKLGIKFEVEIG